MYEGQKFSVAYVKIVGKGKSHFRSFVHMEFPASRQCVFPEQSAHNLVKREEYYLLGNLNPN